MTKLFQNEVAIVTGAGQGIGLEIGRQLAAQGASVVLNDVEGSLVEEAAKNIREEHGACIAIAGDVSDAEFVYAMVEQTVSKFGKVTIAVANAGITLFGDFMDYKPEDFYKVMHVNLGGSFFLAQAASKKMKALETGGSILFMSSVTGHQAYKDLAAYGMSKAAIEMLAKNLVVELSSSNINVNAIAPGATLTERTQLDRDYEKTWSNLIPIGRPNTTADIANAALFLLSPQARNITGQTLIIDGGWTSVSPY